MIVFLDLDGVAADFVGAVLEMFGILSEDMLKPGEYDFFKSVGIGRDELWDKVAAADGLFENLRPYPWLPDLLKVLDNAVGRENVTIFSSPGNGPVESTAKCAAEKIRWIYKHMPDYAARIIIGRPKHLCASSNHVLIDDDNKKVDRFLKAGGFAILFPQKWNRAHVIADGLDRAKYIEHTLDTILKIAR